MELLYLELKQFRKRVIYSIKSKNNSIWGMDLFQPQIWLKITPKRGFVEPKILIPFLKLKKLFESYCACSWLQRFWPLSHSWVFLSMCRVVNPFFVYSGSLLVRPPQAYQGTFRRTRESLIGEFCIASLAVLHAGCPIFRAFPYCDYLNSWNRLTAASQD